MRFEHSGEGPSIHESAHVAATAVISGPVTVGQGSVVLYGAVLTAEGGPVNIGRDCVIMENAVIRGVPGNPTTVGDRVLVGPHAHVTGCVVENDAFLATGCAVFNGARVGAGAEVRIHGVVHVNSEITAGATVPIGWVAVGRPATVLPPSEHDAIWEIQRRLDFPETVFHGDRSTSQGEMIRRYARALARHRDDRQLSD